MEKTLDKIDRSATDEMCLRCFQRWQGQCTAYCLPHSEEERKYRQQGKPVCDEVFLARFISK